MIIALLFAALAAMPDSFALDVMDIYVLADAPEGGDGTPISPFSSIQQGIDAAAPGGTVHVLKGDYHESFYIDKQIYLRGAGIDVVRLYQGDVPSVIAGSDDAAVSGIVFLGYPEIPEPVGTGLRIVDSNRAVVLSCKFPYLQTGVLAEGSEVVVSNNILEFMDTGVMADANSSIGLYANVAVGNGSIVRCDQGAAVDALGNAMEGNAVDIAPECLEAGP